MGFSRPNAESRGPEQKAGPTSTDSFVAALAPRYLTTPEAARYLHRSVSWMLRRKDIPYLVGRPNVYSTADLDAWFERNKYKPKV